MSSPARRFVVSSALRGTLVWLVVALLIGVRFERGVRVAWGTSAARAADGTPGNNDASVRDRAKELLEGVDLLDRAQYQAALERFDSPTRW